METTVTFRVGGNDTAEKLHVLSLGLTFDELKGKAVVRVFMPPPSTLCCYFACLWVFVYVWWVRVWLGVCGVFVWCVWLGVRQDG
jgi:hypothetical protein